MQKLHEQLIKHSNWYAKWHEHPRHQHWHWAAFVLTAAAVTASLAAGILNADVAEAAPKRRRDRTRPQVSVIAPANGANVSGVVKLAAKATDNVGVAGVQFKIDGANYGQELTVSPFELDWSSSSWPAGPHSITAAARDAAGNRTTSASVSVEVAAPEISQSCAPAAAESFTGCYYDNQDFTNLKLTRNDPEINFDWGQGSPDPSIDGESFSVRWQGNFAFNAGEYVFAATGDDGIRVFVDGAVIIDKFFDQGGITYTAAKTLAAGSHLVEMQYYEHWVGAVARLSWVQANAPGISSKAAVDQAFYAPYNLMKLTATVTAASDINGALIATEIYDSANSLASRQMVGANLAANQPYSILRAVGGLGEAVYTVKVAVFSSDRGKIYHYNNNAASYSVGPATLFYSQLPVSLSAQAVQAIGAEAAKPNSGPSGKPLPLAGHWNADGRDRKGFSPVYQMNKVAEGNYLLPWFGMPSFYDAYGPNQAAYYEAPTQMAAKNSLPISFLSSQWEAILYYDPKFKDLPAGQNPNVLNLDGTVRQGVLDPLGPVQPWIDAGREWGANAVLKQLAALYPNPPMIVFISNNEASRLRWVEAETSKRFVDAHGTGTPEAVKQEALAKGWVEKYAAMLTAFKNALPASWQSKVKFIGYDAFGPVHFARWWGWQEFALPMPQEQYIDWSPLVWGGGEATYYLQNWNGSRDDQMFSPQGEMQNQVFMLKETYGLNPDFWFEVAAWDGEQGKRDALSDITAFTPERYGAMIQFGMWLTRPRAVRDFRWYLDTVSNAGAWFDPILSAVKKVHENSTLRNFWRFGELVPNTSRQHPYQSGTLWYPNENRWFFLDTNLDPAAPYDYYTRLPVIALALKMGQTPNRQWLVYAHAPQGDKSSVVITVPEYGQITVNVPVSGAFYLITEGQSGAQLVSN